MRIKFTTEFIDQCVELYQQGRTITEISEILNCHADTISRHLRNRGIDTRLNYIKTKPKELVTVPESVITDYNEGASILALSHKYGISRGCITKFLKKHNIIIRTNSEAVNIRYSRMSIDDRIKLTKPANNSLKGSKYTEQQLINRAQKRSGVGIIGYGEIPIYDALRDLSLFDVKLQSPVGKYNVDILIDGTIAVEVGVSSNNHIGTTFSAKNIERVKYINDRGISIITVLCAGSIFSANLDKIISDIKTICLTPSVNTQNWMIRCALGRDSRLRDQVGQYTSITALECTDYTVCKVD